ncbi:MAG: hypothetical protein EPN37_04515 [Chitinophagaceae bacterium]|nr:MAG: hypothetical protein EPN37_04515 [Chitinophagaceae bacterium]
MENEITEQQIAEWKQRYARVFHLQVGDKECYLKMPDRTILGFATKVSSEDGNPLKFNEVLLQNCWLAGDEEIKKDDSYFFGASSKLDKLLAFKEADLKEL